MPRQGTMQGRWGRDSSDQYYELLGGWESPEEGSGEALSTAERSEGPKGYVVTPTSRLSWGTNRLLTD
jgi:hypothetical protein